MAEVDTGRLERVLGPEWQTMDKGQVYARAERLEASAGFARTLALYMDDADFGTAGEALAGLAARNGAGARLVRP